MSHSNNSLYPDTIEVEVSDQPRRYTRQRNRACLQPGASVPDATIVGLVGDDRTLIEATQAQIKAALDKDAATPCYGIDDGPMSFVPTGRIFVRFERHVDLSTLDKELANRGYQRDQAHSHFKFAGWLTSSNNSDADALAHIGQLVDIVDLQGCEPEMLSVSAHRA